MKIDPVTRARVIDGAVASLNEFYVYPEVAKKMEEALRARQKEGECDVVEDAEAFAELLTDHLQQVSHDRPPACEFLPSGIAQGLGRAIRTRIHACEPRWSATTAFFEKAERLSSNIGYLKFNAFLDPDVCGPTAKVRDFAVVNSEYLYPIARI